MEILRGPIRSGFLSVKHMSTSRIRYSSTRKTGGEWLYMVMRAFKLHLSVLLPANYASGCGFVRQRKGTPTNRSLVRTGKCCYSRLRGDPTPRRLHNNRQATAAISTFGGHLEAANRTTGSRQAASSGQTGYLITYCQGVRPNGVLLLTSWSRPWLEVSEWYGVQHKRTRSTT